MPSSTDRAKKSNYLLLLYDTVSYFLINTLGNSKLKKKFFFNESKVLGFHFAGKLMMHLHDWIVFQRFPSVDGVGAGPI